MMQREFEELAGRTVTTEQYNMIEGLYMASNLNKQDFVKSIGGLLKSIPEEHDREIMVMCVRNKWGENKTPNGCWYLTKKVELVDVNIRTGKIKVKVIPNSFDFRCGYDIDCWQRNLEIIEEE